MKHFDKYSNSREKFQKNDLLSQNVILYFMVQWKNHCVIVCAFSVFSSDT